MGKWLRSARAFLDEHEEVLALRPTWLFSSGPIGSPPLPAAGESFDVTELVGTTHAREHQLFGGKLEKRELGLTERVMASALHVPDGDYREWEAVTAWATTIARALRSEVAV
jgi:menaquinone-dependent protoporphyrinogen oxidase